MIFTFAVNMTTYEKPHGVQQPEVRITGTRVRKSKQECVVCGTTDLQSVSVATYIAAEGFRPTTGVSFTENINSRCWEWPDGYEWS